MEPQNENNVAPEAGENIEQLKKALAEERTRADANLNGWQRAQADFVNYKRYVEQEKVETVKYASVSVIASILPVLDDLERAMAAIPEELAKQNWATGLKLIERKFRDTLEKAGVTAIKAEGEEFDCRMMEAVTCQPGKKDCVLMELQKGYRLNDKVIRPAKVVVGSGEDPSESA